MINELPFNLSPESEHLISAIKSLYNGLIMKWKITIAPFIASLKFFMQTGQFIKTDACFCADGHFFYWEKFYKNLTKCLKTSLIMLKIST